MRRWAVITIALYVLLLVALAMPALLFFDAGAALLWGEPPRDASSLFNDYLAVAANLDLPSAMYWAIVAVAAAAQALMLVVPVRAARELNIKRRHILAPILTAAFLMGVLVAAGLLSAAAAVKGDELSEPAGWSFLSLGVGSWILWIFLFRRYALAGADPKAWLTRITNTLYRGSILELVVAVTSHIVVRRRGDCSAPAFTFFAMGAGIAVMFISFGPGVFYLFAARKRRMMSRLQRENAEPPAPPTS